MSLKGALHWSFFDNTSSIGLSFVSTLFIARLLTPDEIGVFSITASTIAIAQFIRDFGMSSFLIKEEHLSKDKIYSCFTLSLLLSGTVGILFILFSSQIGQFYDRTEIADAVTLLELNFILIPFGTILLALLRRQMRFKAIAAINLSSTISHILVSLSCAFAGFGFYSLIYASLVGTLVTVLGSNLMQRQFVTLK
jgi:O-antigen/teichoic acid export membrane protein